MTPLLAAFIFMFGTVIGSFLSAVLWRLHTGESFVSGRSCCPHCKHTLAPRDLVPALSYLTLGGRCRYCNHAISPSYIVLELVCGALFLAAAFVTLRESVVTPATLAKLLLDWYLLATFVIVFVFDLRHMLILRAVTLPAVVTAAVANIALGMSPTSIALGMVIGAGIFYVQYAVSKGRWVGGGDIQLGLLIGAALGVRGAVAAILLAYITGAMYAVYLLATKKKQLQSQIPFGTFLSACAVVMLLVGDHILAAL